MMVVFLPSLRHQLLLLISIFVLLPNTKIKETIPREKNPQKQKERKHVVTKDN